MSATHTKRTVTAMAMPTVTMAGMRGVRLARVALGDGAIGDAAGVTLVRTLACFRRARRSCAAAAAEEAAVVPLRSAFGDYCHAKLALLVP